MAIMLEQQEKPKNWTLIIGVAVFVVILFVSAYYLFFKNPQAIEELTTSADQKDIQTLSQIKPDYVKLVDQLNKYYQKEEGEQIIEPQIGRPNPFLPI